jgi:ATP-dependent DNA helicase RecG
MENNGSPLPVIETDEEGNYFMVTLPINPEYVTAVGNQAGNIAADQGDDQIRALAFNSLDDVVSYIDGLADQVSNQVSNQVKDIITDRLHDRIEEVLSVAAQWIKGDELFADMGLSNQTKHRKKYLDPILKIGWVEMEFPDKKTSPNQRYRITESGNKLLKLIKHKE